MFLAASPVRSPHADSVVIAPAKDNTIYGENGALSDGQGQHLFAGMTSNTARSVARCQFDIAGAVPAGSTITSVTLTLRLDKTQTASVPVALTKVTADWGEGASLARAKKGRRSAATGDATWTSGSTPRRRGRPRAAMSWRGERDHDRRDRARRHHVELGGMVADVQSWLDTPAGNHGWLVSAPGATPAR